MPSWVVLASLVMGVAAFFAAQTAHRFVMGWHSPKDFGRWSSELEETTFELCRAHLRVAELQTILANQLGKLPENFEPPVFIAARLGVAVERAVLTEAERRGFVPPGSFERLVMAGPGRAQEALLNPEGLGYPPRAENGPQSPSGESGAPSGHPAAPSGAFPAVWEGGKLVPFRRAAGAN